MKNTGWIKLHRCIEQKAIWSNSTPEQKVILITLLLMANHNERQWEWKGEKFFCKPGQFITSLKNIQLRCGPGVSISKIRTSLVRFEKYGFLTMQTTKQGRLITIINWSTYQVEDKNIANDLTNGSQTDRKRIATNKNKRKKEGKKKSFYPDWLDLDLWKDFKDHRQKLKKPMTERAEKINITELQKIIKDGYSQKVIVELSISKGWQSFYRPKSRPDETSSQSEYKTIDTTKKFDEVFKDG